MMKKEIIEPRDMNWIQKGVFGIEWSDSHQGVYPIRYLRQHCPCAGCTDEWTGELRLKPESVPILIMLKDIEPVGRYALRFLWSDGHDTGIYTFANLRGMCQCQTCHPELKDAAASKPRSRTLL